MKSVINDFYKLKISMRDIEASLIKLFLKSNEIKVDSVKNKIIVEAIEKSQPDVDKIIVEILTKHNKVLNFESLVKIYELLIPKEEKKINGAHYTPKIIIDKILDESFEKIIIEDFENFHVCDVSCGVGAFFIYLARRIKTKTSKSYYEIFKNNIYGVDISSESVRKAKVLLSLLAIIDGDDYEVFNFNIIVGNSLDIDFKAHFLEVFKDRNGFDLVIGNPPYVRAKNIDEDIVISLKEWKTSTTGNTDLYIPFIELGAKLLNQDGILGFINVNTFIHSNNAIILREFLSSEKLVSKLIDFGNLQIFENATSYTCILILNKKEKQSFEYVSCNNLSELNDSNSNEITYDDLDNKNGWKLNNEEVLKAIKKLESSGDSLNESYKILNGLATLKNNLFIHDINVFNDDYYEIKFNEKNFLIEKSITKKIIKPNIVKSKEELITKQEFLIFPYEKINNKATIMEECKIRDEFPETYNYLKEIRSELEKRDKGKGNYPAWYAFGRTQGLNIHSKKILFPYMSDKPRFYLNDDKDLYFYCGYAILWDDLSEAELICKILNSDVFWFYIKNTSKDYSGGYKSFAKNYIKNFTIPKLNERQKKKILSLNDVKLNDYLCEIYGLEKINIYEYI